jgi:hypothetical protein
VASCSAIVAKCDRQTPEVDLKLPLTLAAAWVALASTKVYAAPALHPSGDVVLPLTGLGIELPKDPREGHTWSLASSFALDPGFEARDVVDEKVGGKLVSATWVSVGHFAAGGCEAVLASLPLGEAETSAPRLFGHPWGARAGLLDLGETLGKVSAVALCGVRERRKSILAWHMVFDQGTESGKPGAAALKAAAAHPVVAAVARAWLGDQVVEQRPLARSEVRRRGTSRPDREVRLPVSGLTVRLPEDGHVWVPRGASADAPPDVDWIDRLAPALPDLSLEVFTLPDASCRQFLAGIEAPIREDLQPRHLPAGWRPGPVIAVADEPEYLACRDLPGGLLAVGLYTQVPPGIMAGSFRPLHALLDALWLAASER